MKNEITIKSLLPAKVYLPSKSKTYVGIDFGTSTTVVSIAYYDEEKQMIEVKPIPIEQRAEDGALIKSELVPSVIAIWNGKILVGSGAKYLKFTLPKHELVWYSFKMELGENITYYTSAFKDSSKAGNFTS